MTDGVRTRDRWNHNPELYQLSYSQHNMVRAGGLEPPTRSLKVTCSTN
ncbi:hypothetical protein VCHA53O466_40055 [Vibrio chagasii]|nr:hypothetical protein VCHA53O466_40055 [Vibrio chagasii]